MSQKRRNKELKRSKRKKKPSVSSYKSAKVTVPAYKNPFDVYMHTPNVNDLIKLLNSFSTDKDFDLLYEKVIDSPDMYSKISDLEKAIIFYSCERLVESVKTFERYWQNETSFIALNYLFLASIGRSDLKQSFDCLKEIENHKEHFNEHIVNAYRMMYGLTSGQNEYAEYVAHLSLNDLGDFKIGNMIVQVAIRLRSSHLLVKALTSPNGGKLILSLGKRQIQSIEKIIRERLIVLLRSQYLHG